MEEEKQTNEGKEKGTRSLNTGTNKEGKRGDILFIVIFIILLLFPSIAYLYLIWTIHLAVAHNIMPLLELCLLYFNLIVKAHVFCVIVVVFIILLLLPLFLLLYFLFLPVQVSAAAARRSQCSVISPVAMAWVRCVYSTYLYQYLSHAGCNELYLPYYQSIIQSRLLFCPVTSTY